MQKEKKSLESKYGIRYSILLALPYFDPLRFTVIDPMHNLYLGTGKHVFKIWLKQEIINNNDLSKINDLASQFTCPAGVGRIPFKVSSNYGSFTAAQWKTWITVYSAVVLKSILPPNHCLLVTVCSSMLLNWSKSFEKDRC